MIEVAKQHDDVMAVLKARKAAFSDKQDIQTKFVLGILCSAAVNTASIIDEHINDKEIVITTNSGTVIVLDNQYEQVKYSIDSLKKVFRVKREFEGDFFESREAYIQYEKTHNVGDFWINAEPPFCACYEYLLEEKGAYEKRQVEIAQQVAEEASETARNLGGELLVGTPKQQAWAEKIRAEVLAKADKKQAEKLLKQLAAKWWIDNRALSVDELAKKRITKAKSVEEVQEPTEQPVEFTLEDSQKLIAEKLAEFSEEHIKLCLSDACLGYKNRIDSIFDGTSKFKDRELKAFLLYVG